MLLRTPPCMHTPPAGPQDVFCLNSTVGFDSYVTYVFASLVLGARLVVPGPTAHLDPTGMACLIATHGITTMEVGRGHWHWRWRGSLTGGRGREWCRWAPPSQMAETSYPEM